MLWLSHMWAQQTSLLWVVSLISVSFSNSTLCSSSKINFEMTPSTQQATLLAYSSWRHLTKYWFPHAVVPFNCFVARRVFVSGKSKFRYYMTGNNIFVKVLHTVSDKLGRDWAMICMWLWCFSTWCNVAFTIVVWWLPQVWLVLPTYDS